MNALDDLNARWLVRLGLRAWLTVGALLVAAAVFWLAGQLSTFVLPLLCAVLIGMLFAPVVAWLHARRVPLPLAATIVMAFLAVIVFISLKATVDGIIQQAPVIATQVEDGATALRDGLDQAGLATSQVDDTAQKSDEWSTKLADAATGNVSSIFSSVGTLFFGLFTFVFLLYYTLTDWPRISAWAGRSLGVPESVGTALIDDAVNSVRAYFGGVAVSSIVVAAIIGLTMHLLGLPLAFTIALVTFVTSFIPYVGAIVSGAFAFIVALGSGGLTDALIVLAVVLVTQNVIQAVMQTRITSKSMDIHPILNFGAAIIGAITAGALGAIVAPPLTATLLHSQQVLASYYREREQEAAIADAPSG